MFCDSVFPVILVLQPLVLHIACASVTTFSISGQQMCGFKAAVFKLASVMFVFQQVGLLFMRSAQLFTIEMLYFAVGYLKEFSFFDLQYMVLPY